MFIQKGSLNLRVEGAPTVKTLNPTKVSILNPPHATISHISDTAAINDNGRSAPNGTGPVEGEEEVRWKELRRQAWEGLGWKSRSGWEGRRGLRGQLQGL